MSLFDVERGCSYKKVQSKRANRQKDSIEVLYMDQGID